MDAASCSPAFAELRPLFVVQHTHEYHDVCCLSVCSTERFSQSSYHHAVWIAAASTTFLLTYAALHSRCHVEQCPWSPTTRVAERA